MTPLETRRPPGDHQERKTHLMVEGNTAYPLNSNERRSMQVRGHRTNQLAETVQRPVDGRSRIITRGWLPWEAAAPRTERTGRFFSVSHDRRPKRIIRRMTHDTGSNSQGGFVIPLIELTRQTEALRKQQMLRPSVAAKADIRLLTVLLRG